MADLAALYAHYQQCTAVSTDSRQEQAGTLFFALNGPNFRGRDFVSPALAKGARHAVTDDAPLAATDPARYTYAADPLLALQALARYHRQQLRIPVLAITGSNGKTTTKELINTVLSCRYRVQCTQGNLNNHIGVPLTLLSIRPEHELAIVEMGANHQGEIALLSSLAEPTHGLLTNIGKAHLEGFGGAAGVARGKGELLHYLTVHDGTAFVNTADPRIAELAAPVARRITYPGPTDTYPATLRQAAPQVALRLFDGTEVTARITGEYNFPNLAAAAAVGAYFEVPTADIARALAMYTPTNNRSQLVRTAHNEVVLDAYNANPSSMAAALTSFARRPGVAPTDKVVILGDMFELGAESEAEHRALGQLLAPFPLGTVLLCGPDMQHAAAASLNFRHFPTKAELAAWLRQHPLQNRQILIKGSRGMGLETLLELV